jgi:hypothetical protein
MVVMPKGRWAEGSCSGDLREALDSGRVTLRRLRARVEVADLAGAT